ncbi:Coproporphyrinogen III oxidase, partial [Phytophthora palmivora]
MRHFRSLLKPSIAVVVPAALGVTYFAQQQESSRCKGSIPTSEFLYQPLSEDKAPKNSIEFDTKAPLPKRMEALILRVQDEICAGIEAIDGKKFREDKWE